MTTMTTAVTPPPPGQIPDHGDMGSLNAFSFFNPGAGDQIVHQPLWWIPVVVAAVGIVGLITFGSLAALRKWRIVGPLQEMLWAAQPIAHELAAPFERANRFRWVTWGWAILFTVGLVTAVTACWATTTTTINPWHAWVTNTTDWAKQTYGVIGGVDDFKSADGCVIASTNPCLEATLVLPGHLDRVQLAYPSGIPVLVSTATKQTLPLNGDHK